MQRDPSTALFRIIGAICLAWATLTAAPCWSAEDDTAESAPADGKAEAGEAASGKAVKYYELLVKRPEPGYLFDRFYNTWLDESTVDALEAFLLDRVNNSKETRDRLLLAFFYSKKGDDVSALEEYRKALETNPASAATWFHKATVEARTLDFDTAIADLRKAREQVRRGSPDPDGGDDRRSPGAGSGDARTTSADEKLAVQIDKQLGKLLARNRNTAEALKVWQALLASNPKDEELWEDLIELHIEEGLFKEAAELEEKLLAQTKDQYLAVTRRLRLGDIHHRAGDRAKALAAYTTALEAVGSDSWLEREILAQIDQVFRREDDVAGLKKLYEELLTKYAKRIAVRRRHAQLLVEQDDHDAAVTAYREILKLTPGERATREEYISVLAKIGKQDEAVKELQALAEQHPEDAELVFRLASLHQEGKKQPEAVAACEKYLAASDGSEYAHLRAARLLERFEDKQPAEQIYQKMAEKFADSSSAQEAYATFLYGTGRKEEAIEKWRALAKSGDLNQVLQIARTLSARTENEAALELLTGRFEEAKKDPLYLGQLVTAAIALKKHDEAIPWAEERVRLAESITDLEAAIEQAAAAVERADKLDDVSRRLEAAENRSIAETCLLAELLERLGDSGKADEVLKQTGERGGLLAVSQRVRLHSQRREWDQAANATRELLELPGGRKSLYVRRLVELYQRDYQLEEGLKWIDEWKRLSPGSTTPWVTEARMLQGMGKNDEALKVLRTAVLKHEEDEDLRVRLAEVYQQLDKGADAQRIYWQLYEQNEDLNGKLRWAQKLAELAEQQGTTRQLVEEFEERVRSNRQSIVPLLSLSEIYRVTDDYEGRRRALTAAAKIKPDDIYLLQQIARVEEQDGDWQAAVATLERAAALDKTNRTREQIARLHLQNGNDDTGFAMLFELSGAADADPRTLESTADALCAMQEYERAAEFLQQRLSAHPGDYRLRYLLAVALEEAGQQDQALAHFTQLLSDQEELPAKKTQQAANSASQMNSYIDMLKGLMPSGAAEWVELSQYRYQAYMHRQQRGGMVTFSSSSHGGTGMRSAIQLPQNVETVRPMALAHVLTLINTLDEDQQARVTKELESHGIKHAAALGQFDPNRGDFSIVLPQILEKDPEDETALAVLVMQQMGVRDASLGEHCKTAIKKFRESRPQLAFMAAVQAGIQQAINNPNEEPAEGEKAARNKFLDDALKIAETFEKPNPLVIMSLTTALGGRNLGGTEVQLNEDYRQKLSQLLIKWYPEMSKQPMWGSWAFYSAVQSLARNSDPTSYAHFMDDEVARWQTGAGGRQNAAMQAQMYGRGQNPQLLTPLTFPPAQLSDFPPQVLTMFSPQMAQNMYGMNVQGVEQYEPEKVRKLLDDIKSPILRILFAHRVELKDSVQEGLDKMLSAKTPRLDAYLLAAGYASSNEQHDRVVELLQKARYLPMNQEMRRQVDSALVASVVALKDTGKEPDKDLVEAGQQAALRLRRARLDANQRNELVAALEQLGLKKEAEKFDQIAASTSAAPAAARMSVGYVTPQRTPTDRIAQLIAQGNRSAAVKQLANEVSGHAQQFAANPQNARHYRYQFNEVKKRIEAHGLSDDVLKSLDPGTSKNVQKTLEFAVVNQMFDRTTEAREAYERVIELRPRDDTARMQLILMLAPDDEEGAAEQLSQLSKVGRAAFGQMIADSMQDYETPFEERLAVAKLVIRYLQILEESDIQQTYWIDNLLNGLARYMNGRRGSLPNMYVLKSSQDNNNSRSGNTPELNEKRRQIHADLCAQMFKMTPFARLAFKHSLALAEAEGKPLDEFAAQAEKVLLDEASAKPNPMNQQAQYYSSSGESEVRFRTPEEFLANRASKSGDWKLIDEKLLPALAGPRSTESRERLKRLSSLYRCDEDKFLAEAEAIVKQSGRTAQQQQGNEGLAIVVDVWLDRELKVDIRPLLLKQLKLDVAGQNHYQPSGYLMRYIEGAVAKWDRPQQLELFEELATIYIAPRDRRNDFVKKNYNRNRISWGTPNGRIYIFAQMMERLSQRNDLVFTLLEHLDQYEDPKPVQNLEYRVDGAIQRLRKTNADELMKVLEQSPWLADLPDFRPLVIGRQDRVPPLVLLMQQNLNDEKQKQALRELLEKRHAEKPTFGTGLVLAYTKQSAEKSALLDFLAQHLEPIRQLEPGRQAELSLLIQALVDKATLAKSDLPEPHQAVKTWIEGSRKSKSAEFVEKLRKTKRIEELGISGGNTDDFIRNNLMEVIRSDTKPAVESFLRLCELAQDAQRRGQWNYYYGDGSTPSGTMLRAVSYTGNLDWKVYNFVADVLNDERGKKIETGYNVSNICRNIVNEAWNRTNQQQNGKPSSNEERFKAMYAEAGAAIGDRPTTLLVGDFHQQFNNHLNPADIQKLLEWAEKEKNGGQYPKLAADFAAVLELVQQEKKGSAPKRQQTGERVELSAYHEHLRKVLADDGLSLPWRLHVAKFISNQQRNRMPKDFALDIARLYNEALEKNIPIVDGQHAMGTEVVVSLAEEDPAAEVISTWREKWGARYLRPSAGSGSGNRPEDALYKISNSEALVSALRIYFMAGDAEGAKKLLRKYTHIGNRLETIAALVRASQPEEAARVLRSGWPNLTLDWPGLPEWRHDAEIDAQLPALLEKLERADEKYLARVIFASMPDAPKEKEPKEEDKTENTGTAPTRDERLAKLAEEFAGVEFKEPAIKKLCLVLLSSSDPAGKQIAAEVAAAFDQKALLLAAANDDNTHLTQETRLATRHFRNRLREGDLVQFVELIKQLSANPTDQDYQYGQQISPILECGWESLREKDGPALSAEQCASLAEALRTTLLNRDYVNFNNFEEFTAMLIAVHCGGGQTQEFSDWTTKLSNYSRNRIDNASFREEFWKVAVRLNGRATAENLDARMKFVQNFLKLAFDRKWIRRDGGRAPYAMRNVPTPNVLNSVVKAKLMTADEMKANGAALTAGIGTKDEPTYGSAAFAHWLDVNKELEKSAEAWRSIIKIDPESKEVSGSQARYVLTLTRCLKRLNRLDEAKAALAMLDGKKHVPTTTRDYEQLKKELEKPAEQPKPDAQKATEAKEAEPAKQEEAGKKAA